MVKIRLTRTGKSHEPHYRIVAVHDRSKRDGQYIEKIGYYNPRTKVPTLTYDKEILKKWMDRGAQMTDTVYDAFVREGVIKQSKGRKFRINATVERSKKIKQAAEDEKKASEPKPEKPAETKEEKPAAKPEAAKEEKPEKKEKTEDKPAPKKESKPEAKEEKPAK